MRVRVLILSALILVPSLGAEPVRAQLQLTPPPQTNPPPQRPPQPQQPRRQLDGPDGERRQQGQNPRRRDQQQQQQPPADQQVQPTNFPRRLDQRTIRARFFDGQPVQSRTLAGQVFTLVFLPDGRATRTDPRGATVEGRWRFLGDSYCSRWERGNETCHTVVQEGEVVRIVRNTRAVATWSRDAQPAATGAAPPPAPAPQPAPAPPPGQQTPRR